MDYYNIKSLHLIFVITWFAGLFYIVLICVPNEAAQKPSYKEILQAQYKMTYRLWYIMAFCYIGIFLRTGCSFFTDLGKTWLQMPWMHVKLGFVFALYLYHGKCHQIKQLQNNEIKHTTNFMRLWNEGLP
jgi:putative membrane protein